MPAQQPPPIQSLRMILVALISGLFMLTGAAAFLRSTQTAASDQNMVSLLTIIAFVALVTGVTACIFVRMKMRERMAATRDEALEILRQDRVPLPLMTMTIVCAALVEGPGLLGAVTVLLGGPWFVLAVPMISVAALVVMLPSRERFEDALRGSA